MLLLLYRNRPKTFSICRVALASDQCGSIVALKGKMLPNCSVFLFYGSRAFTDVSPVVAVWWWWPVDRPRGDNKFNCIRMGLIELRRGRGCNGSTVGQRIFSLFQLTHLWFPFPGAIMTEESWSTKNLVLLLPRRVKWLERSHSLRWGCPSGSRANLTDYCHDEKWQPDRF